ncbi:hypothetical protein [Thermovibrio ammonificans]|jgi:cell division protein FtsL|uniref:Uncharacterized protein n=1 Tax=Thermovibrio ammonificans (strain DSM 15698 / JCM 12110 / HB-1) TaxID=648996 RepID=E8T2P4_THEA1|nr:hypothetical protein [Thermovibrio ammonificans]ADU97139.1 hypothetical protein Theam_1175 [Thermovibrio ammonificans HB-1]
MLRKLLNATCILSYILSVAVVVAVVSKIISVRSKCTQEKAKISKLLHQIQRLKDENNQLMIRYYTLLRPAEVDKNSKGLKLLHENEVKYVR